MCCQDPPRWQLWLEAKHPSPRVVPVRKWGLLHECGHPFISGSQTTKAGEVPSAREGVSAPRGGSVAEGELCEERWGLPAWFQLVPEGSSTQPSPSALLVWYLGEMEVRKGKNAGKRRGRAEGEKRGKKKKKEEPCEH